MLSVNDLTEDLSDGQMDTAVGSSVVAGAQEDNDNVDIDLTIGIENEIENNIINDIDIIIGGGLV